MSAGGAPGPYAGGVTRGGRDARRRKDGSGAPLLAGKGGCGNRAVLGVSVPCRERHSSFQCPSSLCSPGAGSRCGPEVVGPCPLSVTRVLCWAGGSLTSRGWCKRGRGVLAGTLQGAVVGSHHPRTAPCAGWAQESLLSSFTKGLPVHPLSLQAGGARELLQQGCRGDTQAPHPT